jgi:hypothetical protein
MGNNTGVIPEFTFNRNGVRIKKCCASCATHEPYDSNGPQRLCTLGKKVVLKDDLCGCWRISTAIDRIRTIGHGL